MHDHATMSSLASVAPGSSWTLIHTMHGRSGSSSTRCSGRGLRAATSIAVLPFSVHGDSLERYLADGMARLVANGIDGVGPLRASVYPGAERLVHDARSNGDSAERIGRQFRLDRY